MTNRQRMICIAEIAAHSDRAEYISAMTKLPAYAGCGDDSELGELWDIVTGGVRRLRREYGYTFRALAERFCVPYRTMEEWSRGAKKPTPYLILMMDEILRR